MLRDKNIFFKWEYMLNFVEVAKLININFFQRKKTYLLKKMEGGGRESIRNNKKFGPLYVNHNLFKLIQRLFGILLASRSIFTGVISNAYKKS